MSGCFFAVLAGSASRTNPDPDAVPAKMPRRPAASLPARLTERSAGLDEPPRPECLLAWVQDRTFPLKMRPPRKATLTFSSLTGPEDRIASDAAAGSAVARIAALEQLSPQMG